MQSLIDLQQSACEDVSNFIASFSLSYTYGVIGMLGFDRDPNELLGAGCLVEWLLSLEADDLAELASINFRNCSLFMAEHLLRTSNKSFKIHSYTDTPQKHCTADFLFFKDRKKAYRRGLEMLALTEKSRAVVQKRDPLNAPLCASGATDVSLTGAFVLS